MKIGKVVVACGLGLLGCGTAADVTVGTEAEAALGEAQHALTFACGPSCCDVRDFGGVAGDGASDSAAIQAAITAALGTSHRYVYIPSGTWDIGSPIDMTSGQPSRVVIAGAHSKNTRLRWMNNLNYTLFYTDGGHSYFKVDLRTMTLDGSHLSYASGGGHGVGAANGWAQGGYLHLANLNIVHPGCYGVGIQNGEADDMPAHSVWLTDSFIGSTGSDGIDLKAPPNANNYDVHINNVVFTDIGKSVRMLDAQGSGSDAAIDMTAENFGIYRVSIVTEAFQHFNQVWHPELQTYITGTNVIEGIRLRWRPDQPGPGGWDDTAARFGTISRAYIKYPRNGIFFEGWNNNVVINRTSIKLVPSRGIYVRGTNNTVEPTVCVVEPGVGAFAINHERGGGNDQNNQITPGSTCLAMSEVGALTTNRDSNNWMDVSEPKDCAAAP